ncbi:hypothetical protein [Desulfovibrio sp. JC010]|uniref:hypothetical protein n=1 Tax=Desulfovibrio sp. JC010 TaxID=2593641 RepID=UPI00193F6D1A|nr:hypothetical protein [Desulfovibrio sp. JC010]
MNRADSEKEHMGLTSWAKSPDGKVHAETEFEKYRIIQDRLFVSDFDRLLRDLDKG